MDTLKQVFICKKKSGNYVISNYERPEWETYSKNYSPKELLSSAKSLGFSTIIKSEYSQSQLKTLGNMFNEKDALRAFGLSVSKSNTERYF